MKSWTRGGEKFYHRTHLFWKDLVFLLNCNINIIAMTPVWEDIGLKDSNVGLSNVFPPSFTLESAYLDLILKI